MSDQERQQLEQEILGQVLVRMAADSRVAHVDSVAVSIVAHQAINATLDELEARLAVARLAEVVR